MSRDVFADAEAHTLQSLVDRRACDAPDAPFFLFPADGKTWSNASLQKSLRAFGGLIQDVAPGEAVGAMCANGMLSAQVLLGAPYHGRMAWILNLTAGDAQLAGMLKHSRCKLIFADEENLPRLQEIVKESKLEIRIIAACCDSGAELASQTESPPPAVDANSPALLIYTSGTSGTPKGVMHSHRSLLFGGANTAHAHELTHADRALCVLPLFHINGQCVTVMAPLVSGSSVVLPRKFSAGKFWDWIADYECTWFSAVPTILSHLIHNPAPQTPMPHLRFGRSASSALPPDTKRMFEQKFNVSLVETMGLTETAAQILSNPPPPHAGKNGSPGIAVGNEVRIVGDKGQIMPPDEEGEIAVRGGNVMLGYLRPEQKEDPFMDGWFMTGDLGRMDREGYVFVSGRKKELIIKGGENIAPREIDDALYAVAEIVEAAAFAVPCATYGQQPEAAVVVAEDARVTEQELMETCQRAVGKFKSPRRIHFIKTMPKGPSGKIQRLKLAKQLAPSDS